ncbi:MAG: branched-chain amino acid ABC transporter substrate-binding protein [Gammaproteobacteria bacterium]|nr:MAG: branched-chain amino acid ABC transporter substrate-binding protein [Gammaproteobacteria bacterium]
MSILVLSLLFISTGHTKEIKIGVVMPMSGPIGGFGQHAVKGLNLAHSLNPKLKNGDTVKVILLDNKSDKIESANAATKLISSDKVSAIIGALTSTNTMALTKIADDAKVPVVAPVATNPLVTKNRTFISRVCFNDNFQGDVAANFVFNDLKFKNVVVITDVKNDYSIGISKVFKTKFKAMGGKILKVMQINQGDSDFKAMLSNIKKLKPELVFIPFYSAEVALIAKQANQLGIKTKFLGTDGMAGDKVFFEVGGKAVEGFYGTNLFSPDAPKTTQASKDFDKAFRAKYKEAPHPFGVLSAESYNVILSAMNKCDDPTDTKCVNKNIRATKDFQGVSGIISLNEKGDAVRSAVIETIKDGKSVYLKTVNP